MRVFLFVIMLILLSCSASKIVTPNFRNVNDSNSVVPILFEAWNKNNLSSIVEKLGPPDDIKEEHEKTLYSYRDSKIKDFKFLYVTAGKKGEIFSIYYLLLDENSKIKKDWLLANYFKGEWREEKLPIGNQHSIVQKIILLNDKKKISAGHFEGYKNDQINYLYFDRDGENYKSKELFFLE